MVARGSPHPDKLENDAIVEAALEIRFVASNIPEVLIGRLADNAEWRVFKQQPLPVSDIPNAIRQAEEKFRYQPVMELIDPHETTIVRIGQQVISYHKKKDYPGWKILSKEFTDVIRLLFAKADNVKVERLGLRYINVLTSNDHGINSISDLDMDLFIANEALTDNVNINFGTVLSKDTLSTVRVATREFIQGVLPPQAPLIIDVDIFTKEDFVADNADAVMEWLEFAHTKEKDEFFHLLTQDTIDSLKA